MIRARTLKNGSLVGPVVIIVSFLCREAGGCEHFHLRNL